jgi:hypothetical protein
MSIELLCGHLLAVSTRSLKILVEPLVSFEPSSSKAGLIARYSN